MKDDGIFDEGLRQEAERMKKKIREMFPQTVQESKSKRYRLMLKTPHELLPMCFQFDNIFSAMTFAEKALDAFVGVKEDLRIELTKSEVK